MRVGFAGIGWIGKNRMEAVKKSGLVKITAVADPLPSADLAQIAPKARYYENFEQMLAEKLDGVVIATPSALHAQQAIRALLEGAAVFCQKPLAPNAELTRRVVETARLQNKLLGVDFSYRYVRALQEIRKRIQDGFTGDIYAVRLVFHNAYGPDKEWFYRPELSGGGCVIDLGIHLIDLAMWMLNSPEIVKCSSRLYSRGVPFENLPGIVEDYASARLETEGGTIIDLACSWNLHAGRDAVIEADFIGGKGALALRNVNGSFYDFCALEYKGPKERVIFQGPDNWGPGAALNWARKLAGGAAYDPSIEQVIKIAQIIDQIYKR